MEPNQLADRYIALRNEADPNRRRELIGQLWTDEGTHVLQPPQEIREIAARPGIGLSARLDAHGYEALAVLPGHVVNAADRRPVPDR
jgi:hypothetical protein